MLNLCYRFTSKFILNSLNLTSSFFWAISYKIVYPANNEKSILVLCLPNLNKELVYILDTKLDIYFFVKSVLITVFIKNTFQNTNS